MTAGTALSSLPYHPCALPGSRLTGWQPGAQQRPEEEPGLHAGWLASGQGLPAELRPSALAATCALGSSRPPRRGSRRVYQPPARPPPPALPRAPHPGRRLSLPARGRLLPPQPSGTGPTNASHARAGR